MDRWWASLPFVYEYLSMGDSSSSWPEDVITWLLVADPRSALPADSWDCGKRLPPVGVYRVKRAGCWDMREWESLILWVLKEGQESEGQFPETKSFLWAYLRWTPNPVKKTNAERKNTKTLAVSVKGLVRRKVIVLNAWLTFLCWIRCYLTHC